MKRMTEWMMLVILAVFLVSLPVATPALAQDAGEKIKVENLSDLPVHSYPIEGSVSELLASDADFMKLMAQVKADLESDLAKYQIDDAATLQDIYSTLLAIDLIEGRHDEAREKIVKVKELEDKEAVRLTTGLTTEALIAAREAGEQGSDAYREAFKKRLAELVYPLPWDVVQDRIQQSKGRSEIINENLLLGMVQSQLDPVVAKSGELSADLARQVISIRFAIDNILPLKQEQLAVYQQMIDQNKVEKENIWPARDVELDPTQRLAPVVIGIWDSGLDADVFEGSMWVNKKEKIDGKDSDGNGYIDDVYGIAYDVDGKKTPDLLHPEGDQAGKVDAAMAHLKGLMDLQAAIDSEEASELKKFLGSLSPDQVEDFTTSLGFCAVYSHGTHVAGIAVAGNPFGRILGARITFDYHTIPKPVTKDIAERHAKSYGEAVRYFQKHGVRVANMSWGWTFKEIEGTLEANGIGDSAEERKKMALEIFDILSDGLYDALKSAPEILFVSAAGNEDSDVEFDKVIPSSYLLPNLLIVGAVDQAGERTSFTSEGTNVVVYANGFEVDSYVPGGERMEMSGTSMASPNAANLAAKLITLRPDLTPEQTIVLIKEGADSLPEQQDLLLLNPKATVELLQKQS